MLKSLLSLVEGANQGEFEYLFYQGKYYIYGMGPDGQYDTGDDLLYSNN